MGQDTSREACEEAFNKCLNLPFHNPRQKNETKTQHKFFSVVSIVVFIKLDYKRNKELF